MLKRTPCLGFLLRMCVVTGCVWCGEIDSLGACIDVFSLSASRVVKRKKKRSK